MKDILPGLVRDYGTRQIWLPNTKEVAEAVREHINIYTDELNMICIAVEDPWANPLYAASKRAEIAFNYHERTDLDVAAEVKRHGIHQEIPFLCLEDTRIDWGIGKRAEKTTTGYKPVQEKPRTRGGKKQT